MNIAKRFIEYYSHEDFIENYAWCLMDMWDTGGIARKIVDIVSLEYSDYAGNALVLTDEQAKEIAEYIYDNLDDFIDTYTGYYVGSSCLDAISFGEQEEQLTGLWNHKTNKDYNLKYLQKVFGQEGYYVTGEYAYYDLSGEGIYIDLFKSEIPLLEELIEQWKND